MSGASLVLSSASNARKPLIDLIWPTRPSLFSQMVRNVLLVVVGTALLTLSAKINLPLPYVPMTMQSLVVLLIGAAYGWRLGTATILAYLVEGAMGLPVFAGPIGGFTHMTGPTGGYLAGFVLAAFIIGWVIEQGWNGSILLLFVVMSVGHVLILSLGFGWLIAGFHTGMGRAWQVGVVPFLAGAVIKSALGALILWAGYHFAHSSRRSVGNQ